MLKRDAYLRKKYGIDTAIYDTMLVSQNGCCAICHKPESHFKKRLAVDHNHRTGEVRGLLCFHCNRRLIGRHTDPELFRQASIYLSGGTGYFVPKRKRKRRKKK